MNHAHNFKGRRYEPVEEVKVVERREDMTGTYWRLTVNGAVFHCANERGRMVRIPFKRRGENRGFHWDGTVRNAQGRTVWSDRVAKSTGPLAMLHAAGVVRWRFEQAPDA